MFLSRRSQALETRLGTSSMPALIIAAEDTDAEVALERAKAQYKEEHPDWQNDISFLVWVNSQETKDTLSQTIAKLGER
jgi:hypothetical protein